MTYTLFTFFIAALVTALPVPVTQVNDASPAGPLKGVAWHPPVETATATADMQQMAAMGVEALRVPAARLHETNHLPMADSLGLRLFVDLPFQDLTAGELADSLAIDSPWIDRIGRWVDAHPSIRHIGLARHSDTGSERACRALEQFAGALRDRSSGPVQVYYTTSLIAADRCASTVDIVLLEGRDVDAATRLARWRHYHPNQPTGLASLGARAAEGANNGLRNPHSTSAQARFLETQLQVLLKEATHRPEAIFVYAWRDPVRVERSADIGGRMRCCYGLVREAGEPRAALDVVEGFYSGTQTVFSFPAGSAPIGAPPWVIIAGWLTFGLLGGIYATSLLIRRVLPRYVMAPGFYRELVYEGRELPRRATYFFAGVTALAGGTTGAGLLTILRDDAATAWLLARAPAWLQSTVDGLLAQTWLLIVLLSAICLLSLMLSAAMFMLLSARKRRLSPAQGLTLVLWPRWPLYVLMIGAMVGTTLATEQAHTVALTLLALWFLLVLIRTFRIIRDADYVIPSANRLQLAVLSPLTPLLLALAAVFLLYPEELAFLWRLLTGGA